MSGETRGCASTQFATQMPYDVNCTVSSVSVVSKDMGRSISKIPADNFRTQVTTAFTERNLINEIRALDDRKINILDLEDHQALQISMARHQYEYQQLLDYCLALELQLVELRCPASENSQLVKITNHLISALSTSPESSIPVPENIEQLEPLYFQQSMESPYPHANEENIEFFMHRERYLNSILTSADNDQSKESLSNLPKETLDDRIKRYMNNCSGYVSHYSDAASDLSDSDYENDSLYLEPPLTEEEEQEVAALTAKLLEITPTSAEDVPPPSMVSLDFDNSALDKEMVRRLNRLRL